MRLTSIARTLMAGRDVTATDCRRWILALGRTVGNGNVEDLAELASLVGAVQFTLGVAVSRLREHGITDAEIAGALGVSRQAVQKRWPEPGRPTGAGARYRAL
jgi:hypothetical protein